MKYFLPIFLTFFNVSFAQVSLIGALNIKGAGIYSYKLVLKPKGISSQIVGYSITDMGGKNETKSSIIGSYDSLKREITFKETKVLQSKVKVASNEVFCFVNGKIKGHKVKNQIVYQGEFKGYGNDGKTICAQGEISMVDKQNLVNALSQVEQKDESIGLLKKQLTKNEDPIELNETKQEDIQENIVTKEQGIHLKWRGKTVTLQVWDDGHYDEDKVSIVLNGKTIANGLILKLSPMEYVLNLEAGENRLIIKALNEGKVSPNSAKISLTDGEGKNHSVLSYNNKGDESEITLEVE